MPNTLGDYRHVLADAAGYNLPLQATATASAANQVVCSQLQSTELETTFLANTWEYQPSGPNAGEVRRVVSAGLQPNSGTITVERNHTAATPSGTTVEIYGKLPPVRYEGRLGLNDIVNRVLAECWTIQTLSIAAVQDQRTYPMGTVAPWLQAEDQVVEVYYRSSGQNPLDDDNLMQTWRWVPGGDNPGIEILPALNSGDTLRPRLFVPMSWWINTGTGFSLATTEGLVHEADQAILPIRGMEIIGTAWIYGELAKWGLPDDQAVYRQLRGQARAAANQWKRLTLEHPKVRKQHWPAVLTVRSRDNLGYGYGIMSPG